LIEVTFRISNTRSASGVSLPESANGGQTCGLFTFNLYHAKWERQIFKNHYLSLFSYLIVMFYTYDVSNRPIPGNIADKE
jgi:hypothetical protein